MEIIAVLYISCKTSLFSDAFREVVQNLKRVRQGEKNIFGDTVLAQTNICRKATH